MFKVTVEELLDDGNRNYKTGKGYEQVVETIDIIAVIAAVNSKGITSKFIYNPQEVEIVNGEIKVIKQV